MHDRALGTYLADHLAGAAYAIELIRSCRKAYPEPPLGPFFDRLLEEVEQDRDVLRAFALRIGASESKVKDAAAWALEKLSRLKHVEPRESAGTGLLERLETLAIGIRGKIMLWQALDAASGGTGRFGGIALADLVQRAERQRIEVEHHRLTAAREAFTVADPGRTRWGADRGATPGRPLRAVLLDLDGTLIDSNDAHARAWCEALTEAGHERPFQQVRPLVGMGGDRIVSHVTDLDPDSEEVRRIALRHGEIFVQRHLATCEPFPSVRRLLERMRATGLALAVATSAEPEVEERVLDAARVADLIDRSTGAGDVEDAKPDPAVFEAAMRAGGWSREDVLVLGDTPYDVAAGEAAGIGVVALRCGGSGDAELAGAVAVYADPAELLERFGSSPFARTGIPSSV